ncbi:MAG: hypothetical protein ACI857_001368 [Arenicella sp.]|jgi:hypothetical protein
MKKIYTLCLLLLGASTFAQNIDVHENGSAITGTSFEVDSAASVLYSHKYFYLVNTTGAAIDVTWSRTRDAHASCIIEDQICDFELCFTADDQTTYQRPQTFSLAAGDSSIFEPKAYPNDAACCVIYSYKIFTGLGNLEETLTIKWQFDGANCFLGAEEEDLNIEYSAYPNPATDLFNIQLKTNNNDVSVKVFNILGETVMTENLSNGLNQLAINKLNSGVYFYSIIKNGRVVETKKLIKR